MKTNSIYGLALIVGMVAGIVTMAFHPTGFDPGATAETVAHEMSILVAVHILALMSIPLLIFGFAGVTMRAGWHRPEALLAFIIYALSAVALMLAGITDGPRWPTLWSRYYVRSWFGLIVLLQASRVIAVGVSMVRAENDSVPVTSDAIQP